jgi:uncharacterized protein (DUF427 family)
MKAVLQGTVLAESDDIVMVDGKPTLYLRMKS